MADSQPPSETIHAGGSVTKIVAESMTAHRDLIVNAGISEGTLRKILAVLHNPGASGPALKAKSNFADADIRWNRFFTGREADLARLHAALAKSSQAISHTIYGAGGVGKTELARAFAFTFSDEYDGVWWIDASEAGFSNSVIRAYRVATGSPAAPDARPEDVARELRALWSDDRHLVILDNLDSPAPLSLFPPGGEFRVLATTRLDLSSAATIDAFKVDVLSEDAAVELLTKQTAARTPPHPEDDLRSIARAVDCHTLAVALAGAYLAKYRDVEARNYPAMLAGKIAEGGEVPSDWGEADPLLLKYYHSIRSCLSMHFDKFAGKREMVLLGLASFCAPTAIPLDVLAKAANVDLPTARTLARNLADLSIIDYQNTLSVHRLTQAVVRSMLDNETRDLMIDAIVEALKPEFENPDDHTRWSRQSTLAAHADAAVSHASSDHPTTSAAKLANSLGIHSRATGRYDDGLRTWQACLYLTAATFGPEHPNMATLLSNLATIQKAKGDLPGARQSMERAIEIKSKHFDLDHHAFAISYSNLATIQQDQGDLPEARKSMERAIEIKSKHFDSDHPTFATSYSNLASIQQAQGDLPDARRSIERAIEIRSKHFAPDHWTFATSYNNLAMILYELGDFVDSLRYKQLSMEIEDKHLGKDHPQLGASYSNLALIQQAQGDLPAARTSMERAIEIQSKHFDPNHPDFATLLNNLAVICLAEGNRTAAREYWNKALAIRLKHFDESHRHVKSDRAALQALDSNAI